MAAPRISKAAFERTLPALRDDLLDLQLKLHTSKSCAVAVIIAGTPAAGRSETVNELLEWLDPKHIGVHALGVSQSRGSQVSTSVALLAEAAGARTHDFLLRRLVWRISRRRRRGQPVQAS